MTIYVPGKLTLRQTYIGVDDPDAADYIAAVEAADEAASPGIGGLETATKVAIHSFVKGCKNDGIWPAIKASCILAGARTLAGALVPLVGSAPTNVNFVAGDYNRETGLGDPANTTKYLSSNVNANASPVLNNHLAVYASSVPTTNFTGIAGSSLEYRLRRGNGVMSSQNHSTSVQSDVSLLAAGFIGMSRSVQSSFIVRGNSTSVTASRTQDATSTANITIFALDALGTSPSNAHISFYSIGEALDLALLDARVTDLMTALGAAIP